MAKYNHTEEMHNMQSPRELIPHFLQHGEFKSIVDVGCGLGTFLRGFIEVGITDILGIDGNWCKKDLLFKNIDPINFMELDLEVEINIDRKFDLAISLEVAEHLSIQRAHSFVKDLCNLSDTVIFSAALPFQGGDHHINEQPLSYWINLFNNNHYKACDVIRPVIWENTNIFWWYRQNIMVFKKVNSNAEIVNDLGDLIDVVHPELLKIIVDPQDKNAVKRHTKLLLKSLFAKLRR